MNFFFRTFELDASALAAREAQRRFAASGEFYCLSTFIHFSASHAIAFIYIFFLFDVIDLI